VQIFWFNRRPNEVYVVADLSFGNEVRKFAKENNENDFLTESGKKLQITDL